MCLPRISSYARITLTKKVRKGVKGLKPAHLNSMAASDEDAVYTNGRPATRGPTLDHNMVCVTTMNLKLRPFYRHELGVERFERSQTSPSQLDAGV